MWARKNLDTLAGALAAHLSSTPANELHANLLGDLCIRAKLALASNQVNESTLHEARTAVCRVCRQHQLYACDVPAGWSVTCALLKKNA